MARSLKLNDLHLILLSTAAERNDGAVLPAAASIADQAAQISKALAQLLKHKLVEEVPARSTEATKNGAESRQISSFSP